MTCWLSCQSSYHQSKPCRCVWFIHHYVAPLSGQGNQVKLGTGDNSLFCSFGDFLSDLRTVLQRLVLSWMQQPLLMEPNPAIQSSKVIFKELILAVISGIFLTFGKILPSAQNFVVTWFLRAHKIYKKLTQLQKVRNMRITILLTQMYIINQ